MRTTARQRTGFRIPSDSLFGLNDRDRRFVLQKRLEKSRSTLVITSAQTIENFGWSTASAGGVLDLSKFTFEDVNSAALYVNSIQVGASNVIRVDINKMAVDAKSKKGIS